MTVKTCSPRGVPYDFYMDKSHLKSHFQSILDYDEFKAFIEPILQESSKNKTKETWSKTYKEFLNQVNESLSSPLELATLPKLFFISVSKLPCQDAVIQKIYQSMIPNDMIRRAFVGNSFEGFRGHVSTQQDSQARGYRKTYFIDSTQIHIFSE
eukprot:TRINITY_DN94_c0_g1_i18.p1 TRINITY_DN94_c0_g1~~TRINITY_DN94_c0_g1_i18.p1  ORF type:complete len:154 (+),score=9.00 TRINITY_DN94_c0_g1_i18:795-1256(+)